MKQYRVIPHKRAIVNQYYKVQAKTSWWPFWYTVSTWFSTIAKAEQWINETANPKYYVQEKST